MKSVIVDFKGKRKFPLKINQSDDPWEEVEALHSEFKNFALKDEYFKKKMEENYVIFEKFDILFDNFIELNGAFGVEHGDSLNLKLVPKSPMMQINPINLEQEGLGMSCEQSTPQEHSLNDGKSNAKRTLTFDLNDNDMGLLADASAKKRQKSCRKVPAFSKEDFPLPSFSSRVMKIIVGRRILLDHTRFVQEATSFLLEKIPFPTPTEYKNYVEALLNAHPDLNFLTPSKTDCLNVIKKYISQRARNIRKNNDEENESEKIQKKPKKKRSILKSIDNIPPNGGSGLDQVLLSDETDELQFFVTPVTANANVALWVGEANLDLLKSKVSELPSIVASVQMFPALRNPAVIRQILSSITGFKEEELVEKVDVACERLSKISRTEILTEGDKLKLFLTLEEDLHPQSYKRYPRAVSIFELSSEQSVPEMPEAILSNAPVSISYVNPVGEIKAAFLLAENTIICSFEEANCAKVILTLLGCFYAWDRAYPTVSKSLLDFLDFSLLGKSNRNTKTNLSKVKKLFSAL